MNIALPPWGARDHMRVSKESALPAVRSPMRPRGVLWILLNFARSHRREQKTPVSSAPVLRRGSVHALPMPSPKVQSSCASCARKPLGELASRSHWPRYHLRTFLFRPVGGDWSCFCLPQHVCGWEMPWPVVQESPTTASWIHSLRSSASPWFMPFITLTSATQMSLGPR